MTFRIYTKTGDKGETGLYGGKRVAKDSLRIQSYGTVDELNSIIGLALTEPGDGEAGEFLVRLQNRLFDLGSDLATPLDYTTSRVPIPRISEELITELEHLIDKFTDAIEPLKYFILPGGTKRAAQLHVARTVCRRAERDVVALSHAEQVNTNTIVFLNRLSDLLFVLSRYENHKAGVPDTKWEKE